MKKLSKVLVVLLALFVFAGCSLKKDDKKDDTTKSSNETSETETNNSGNGTNTSNTSESNFIATFNEEKNNASHILTCEVTDEDMYTYGDIIWEDSYLTKLAINVKVTIDGIENYSEELFNQIAEISLDSFKEQFGIDENTKGAAATIKSNYKDATMTVTIYIDLNTADQNIIDNFLNGFNSKDLEVSVDDMKSNMEQNGYTCKITK